MRRLLLAVSLALGLTGMAGRAAAQSCTVMKGVLQAGGTDYTSIAAAAADIPNVAPILSGDYCISVLDTATYNEQVEVRNVVTNGFRVYIGTDTTGARPVVSPPAGSTAAFVIANASVSVLGLEVVAAQSLAYGVRVASASVELASMTVTGGSNIWLAGVEVSTEGVVAYSIVAVQGAYGILFPGVSGALVTQSTVIANSSAFSALRLAGADANTVEASYAQNLSGDAIQLFGGSDRNRIDHSTAVSNAASRSALSFVDGSSNTVEASYFQNFSGDAVSFASPSWGNEVHLSTMASNSSTYRGLYIVSADSNTLTRCYIHNQSGDAAALGTGADRNTISLSTVVAAGANGVALRIAGASNTVTGSFVQNLSTTALVVEGGANNNVLELSTFTTNSAAPAAFVHSADNNSFESVVFRNPGTGYALFLYDQAVSNVVEGSHMDGGLRLDGGNSDNTITGSTMTSSLATVYALYMQAGSDNMITRSLVRNMAGTAAHVWRYTQNSTIHVSTVVGGGASDPALLITDASTNTVWGSYVENPSGTGVRFDGTASSNTIAFSTVTNAAGATNPAVYFLAGSTNSVTDSYVFNQTGYAVVFASSHSAVVKSTVSTGGIFPAIHANVFAVHNAVSQSIITNPGGAAVNLNGAFTTVSQSTLTSAAGGSGALNLVLAGSNTVTGCYIQNLAGDAAALNDSYFNSISLSTMVSNSGSGRALYLLDSDSNTVTGSVMRNPGGDAAHFDLGADANTISLSTMVSAAPARSGLAVLSAQANRVFGSYIQGSTAAVVNGSTGTHIGGSVLVATHTAGSALFMAGGSNGLTVASSTLLGPSLGQGLSVSPANKGVLSIGSVTVSGAARGLSITGQDPAFVLAVDSVVFRGLASGATAFQFVSGQFVSTITLAHFEDANVAVNVNSIGLNPASRITMRYPRGPRLGPTYENDPAALVDWPGYETYPGCALTFNVGFDQPYSTIQSAVNALPTVLSGHTCVVVRDAATYPEQVTVANFANNGSSLTIRHHIGLAGTRATVRPPPGVDAAFRILNASVNVVGLDVFVDQNIPYGVYASSGWVTISSVTVSTGAPLGVTVAGIRLSSWSVVEYTSASVSGVPALELGSEGHFSTVRFSTFVASAAGPAARVASSSNTITRSSVRGSDIGLSLQGSYNTVSLSTLTTTGSGSALYLSGSDSNTVTDSYLHGGAGPAVNITGGADLNVIRLSTALNSTPGFYTVYFQIGSSNTLTGSYVSNSMGGPLVYLDGAADYSTVSLSTLTSTSGATVLQVNGSWNTLTGLYGVSNGGVAVFMQSGDHNLLEKSTFTAGTGVALQAQGVTASTFTRLQVTGGSGAAFQFGSDGNVISLSSFAGGGSPALYLLDAASNTISGVYAFSSATDSVRLAPGSEGNVISGSTFAANGMTYGALRLQNASSNTLTGVQVVGNGGQGLQLESGATLNLVSASTLTSMGGGFPLYLNGAGSNTVTGSWIQNPSGTGVRIANTVGATLSLSTVAGGGPAFANLFVSDSSSLTFHGLAGPGCSDTCLQLNNVNFSRVSASSLTTAGGGRAISMSNSSWNVVTASYLEADGGTALRMELGSGFNSVSQSSVVGASFNEALFVSAAVSNTFGGVFVQNLQGRAALFSAADGSRVFGSSVVGRDEEGLRIESSTGVWVIGSYVQGATAAYVSNSYKPLLHSSYFAGVTGPSGAYCAVTLQGAGQPTVSSSTLSSQGDGVCLEQNNYGLVLVASNTLAARRAGVYVRDQSPQTPQIWISSNSVHPVPGFGAARGLHFDNLASGATVENNSVYFRNAGGLGGSTVFGLSGSASSGLMIRRNRFNVPNTLNAGGLSMIDLSNMNGSFHNNDVHVVALTPLSAVYLVGVNGGAMNFRDNIFSSSATASVANSTFTMFVSGGASFQSNYNVFHSSNGPLSFHWNGTNVSGLPAWISQSGRDAGSTEGHPRWANTANFAEDFHVKSTAGRYDPAAAGFVLDAADSTSLDAADPASAYADEPAPHGYHANAGSTGGTSEASKSPAGACAVVRKVCKTGGCPYTSIQSAVNSLPNPLVGHSCVSIRDTSTYNESVTVASFTLAGSSITIAVDPAFSTGAVIQPSISGGAILDIRTASVTVAGPLYLRTFAAMNRDYGVYVASPSVRLSSINVAETSGQIVLAGVRLSTESALSYSTITVTNMNAYALVSSGAYVTVSYASMSWDGAGGTIPVFEMRGASGTLTGIRVHSNNSRDAVLLAEVSNLSVAQATFTSVGGFALRMASATSVQLTGTVLTSGGGRALNIDSASVGVTVDRSSLTASPAASIPVAALAGSSHVLSNAEVWGNGTGTGVEVGGSYHRLSTVSVRASDYAVRLTNSTGTLVEAARLTSTGNGGLLIFGGYGHSIADSTMTAAGAGGPAALRIQGSSSNTVTRVLLQNTGGTGYGLHLDGASSNTVAGATMTLNGGIAAVYFGNGSSSNTLSDLRATNYGGHGLYFDAFASGNVVDRATVTAMGFTSYGVGFNNASSNTLTGLVVVSTDSYGLYLSMTSRYNSVARSSVTALGSGDAAVYLSNSSSNSIAESYIWAPSGNGMLLSAGSGFNTVSRSTVVTGAAAFAAFEINNSTMNRFQGGVIRSTGSYHAAFIQSTADHNTVEDSLITLTGGALNAAYRVDNSSNNALRRSFVSGPADAVELRGVNNRVVLSTAVGGQRGVYLDGLQLELSGSYVQGSTAVYVNNPSTPSINGNRLAATGAGASAVYLTGGGGLSFSSNTVTGPSGGFGLQLGANTGGLLRVSTNTFLPGPMAQLLSNDLSAGSELWITSNTFLPTVQTSTNSYGVVFAGLSRGATVQYNSFVYRGTPASMSPYVTYGLFAIISSGIRVDHNRYSNPGMVTAGGAAAFHFSTTGVDFRYNDVFSSGTANTAPYQVQIVNAPSVSVRNNIFANAMTAFSAQAVTLFTDIPSQAAFSSDYNDFHMISGNARVGRWGGINQTSFGSWQSASGQDAQSLTGDPLWFSTGTEDFHPRSAGGRWDPLSQSFVNDALSSPTIDKGDPAEPVGAEQFPGASRVNMGSYGQTLEASKAAPPAGCSVEETVAPGFHPDIQTAIDAVGTTLSNNPCVVIRQAFISEGNITVPVLVTNGNRLTVMGEPGVAVVLDSGGFPDGFIIAGASVTIRDLTLRPSLSVARAVRATGSDLRLSSVTLDGWSKVTGTAVSVTSGAVVESSSFSAAGVALQLSGVGASVLNSTAVTSAASSAALRLDGTLDAALAGVYAGATGSTAAVLAGGAQGTTVSASSFTSSSGWAFHVLAASRTVVSGSWLQAPNGTALRFDGASYDNKVIASTITTNGATQPAVAFAASSNTVTESYIGQSGTGSAVTLSLGTSRNTLSSMSIVGASLPPLVDAWGSSSNTFSGLRLVNQSGITLSLGGGSSYNRVELSTVVTLGAATHALDILNSTGTVVSRSYVEGSNNAVRVLAGSNGTLIELSTMSAQNDAALNVQFSSYTTVSRSVLLNSAGNRGFYALGAHLTSVNLSTVAIVSVSGFPGMELSGGADNAVQGSYVQGGRGVTYSNETRAAVLYSTVHALGSDQPAVWFMGSSSGLRVSSSVIQGGGGGLESAGVRADATNAGQISITTNTFLAGPRYGIMVGTQSAGGRVHIAGNRVFATIVASTESYGIMLTGVRTGATVQDNSVYFRDSAATADTAFGIYTRDCDAVLIERNRVSQPGVQTTGSSIGIGINATPRAHVRFNDVYGAGSGLGLGSAAFAARNSTGIVLTNNALSTWFTGASTRTIDLDLASANGLRLGYNLYHSSAGPVTAYVNGGVQGYPFTFPLITDPDPLEHIPHWFSVAAGAEDFHPRSQAGRWDPSAGTFVSDGWTSASVDHADEDEPVGAESTPNGSRANIGSYGGTAEASRSPAAPGSPAVDFADASSIRVTFSDSGSPQGHVVGASTAPMFDGVTQSSQGAAGAIPLLVSALNPNVTYYLIAGAVWGDAFIFSGVVSTPTHAQMPAPAATPFPEVNVTSASVSWGTQANPLGVTTYTVTFSSSVSFPNTNPGNMTVSSLPSVSAATAAVTGLIPNTTYWAFIAARNHAGVLSAYLQPSTATLAAAPSALTAGSPTDTTVPLSWNANGNPLVITTYTVRVSTASDFTGTADFLVSSAPALGAGMTPGGLTPASTYYFRLRAVNHGGWPTDTADAGPFVTLPLLINPPVPGAFTAGSSVTLTAGWSLSSNATGYTLVASTMNVSPPVDVADSSSTAGQSNTSASVDGLTPNTTYFLFVRAHGNNGNSPYAAFTATATQPALPLSAVSTFTDVAESSFTVSWLANGNPLAMTTYTIVASTASNFNSGASSVTLSTVPAFGPSATLTLLNPYTLYYVQVRALGQGTGATAFTNLGSTQTLPVSLSAPTAGAIGVSASSASAAWSLVSGATGYSLVASPSPNNPPVSIVSVSSIAGGNSSNGAVFGLAPLTTYYLFVRADGPGNSGAYAIFPATATNPLPPQVNAPAFSALSFTSLDAHWAAGSNPVGIATYAVTLSTYGVFPNSAGSNQTQSIVPATAVGTATFAGLQVNTTYHVFSEALSHAGARFGAIMGSTATLANPPLPGSILKNGVSSVTVQWGINGNPAITSYTVVASTASDFNAFASSVVFTTASVSGVATVPGLSFGTSWYFQVRAVNHGGAGTAFANLGSTHTYLSQLIPLVVDNQSGDDVWRRANTALYDVDFADGSGLGLDKVQVSVSTSPGGAADLVSYVDTVIGLGGAPSYATDFGLPAAAFNAIPEGSTAYVSVRIFNLVPATNTLVDAFYVRKDTTAPVVSNFELGGDTVVQTAAGRLYDLRVRDVASGLAAFQYSVSLAAGAGDASQVGWTDIAALSGATDYTTPWPVDFAALRDGVTNYVSIRAWDVAGSTTQVNDAFKVFKDTTGPTVSISTPNVVTTFVSTAASAGGNVSGSFGVSGASVAVQQVVGGLYWNGSSFISATPVWIPATGGSTWTVGSLGVPFVDGTAYRLIARGSTPYGLFSTRLATAAFTFDSTAPSVGVTSPTALATVASIPQLSGTAADGVAGVVSIEVRLKRLSDGQWWNWFTDAFGATPVSSVTAGGATWSVTPSALLQASMRSGASYYVAVRANDNATPANSGDFFLQGSTFTFDDPTPPAAVTDLAAVNGPLPGDVRLTWTAPGAHGSNGITQVGQYAVFASTDMLATPSTSAALVIIPTGTVIPGQFQGYVGGNGTLTPGGTYFIRVALSNADGNWGAFSNQASTTATPAPSNTILGHVVNASTQGITAVRIDAYNDSGALVATAFTVADGSGTYSVTGLSAGNYKIEASWTANGITSSAWIDGIPMGSVNIDFVLNINYALATLTGTLGALSSQGQAGLGVAGAGYRPSVSGSHVELFQRGTEVARVSPDPTGRWTIGHLLPGSYQVRAYTGLGYTDFQDVDLAEGEIRTVGFVFNPLPDAAVFAFPNPARHSTTIRFETALQPLEAQIAIFDLKGSLVREVPGSQITATATPGLYHYVWDLTNMQGRGVASGVYLFMVKVKGGSENQLVKVIKKLAVVR